MCYGQINENGFRTNVSGYQIRSDHDAPWRCSKIKNAKIFGDFIIFISTKNLS